MSETRTVPVVAAALVLSLGVGLGLYSVGSALEGRNATGITATGSATIDATADSAAWGLTLNKQAPTVTKAVDTVLGSLNRLRNVLAKQGITADQLTIGGVSTNPVYGNNGPTGDFEANAFVRIRSKNVQQIADLNANVGPLLQQLTDVTVNTQAPEYYVSKLADLRPEVQKAAVRDAEKRASVMVEAIGGTLGSPLSIKAGSVTVTAPDAVEVEYAGYDLSTIKKSIRAVVTVTFNVQ